MDTSSLETNESPSIEQQSYAMPFGQQLDNIGEEKKEDTSDIMSFQTSADGSVDTSVMEAKVEILYHQMEEQAKIMQQLKAENIQTKEDAELLEKECSDCMQELSDEVDELKETIQERDDLIAKLRRQSDDNGDTTSDEDLLAEIEDLQQQLEERDNRIEELEESQDVNDELKARVEALEAKLAEKDTWLEQKGERVSQDETLLQQRDEEIKALNIKVAELQESHAASDTIAADEDRENNMAIQALMEKDEMNNAMLKQKEEDVAILKEQLANCEQKLQEMNQEVKTLKEKDEMNTSLLRQKEEDVEILYEKMEERDQTIKELGEQVELYSSGQELLQEREAAYMELTTQAQELKEQLEEREIDIELLKESQRSQYEEMTNTIQGLKETLKERNSRISNLEHENKLNDDLIKELRTLPDREEKNTTADDALQVEYSRLQQRFEEKSQECQQLQVQIEALSDELNTLLQQKADRESGPNNEQSNLKERLEARESECQDLSAKIEALSTEFNAVLQQKAEGMEKLVQAHELRSMLEAEQSRCEQLSSQVESLTQDLTNRAQKVSALGFNSDDQLIDAFIENKRQLREKGADIEGNASKLAYEEIKQDQANQANGQEGRALSDDDDNIRKQMHFISDTLTDMSERKSPLCMERQKMVEFMDKEQLRAVMDQQRAHSEQLQSKVHTLTSDIKGWETQTLQGDNGASILSQDVKSFCSHISIKAEDLLAILQARADIEKDLEQILQLNSLDTTTGKALEKDVETRKSGSFGASNEAQLLGTKVQKLLGDVKDREEKLQTLEWLTMDLSKALDSKTVQLAETEMHLMETYNAKNDLKEKVDLFLKDAEGRESRIQGLKKRTADLEASISQGNTQREGLQSLIDSLTEDLKTQEDQVESLTSELESKKMFIKMRESQLQQELKVKGETDSRYISLQEQVDEKDRICGELLADVEAFEESVKQRDRQIEELEMELATSMEVASNLEAQLTEKQKLSDEMYDQVESLKNTLQVKEQNIEELGEDLESSIKQSEELKCQLEDKDRLSAELASLGCSTQEKNRLIQLLEAEKKEAKEALEGAKQSLQVASDQLEELKEQNAELHGACESKAGKVTEIGQQLSQKEEEYALLSSEFESQKDQTKALEKEIALLSSELEAQKNQTKELEKEIALKEEVAQELEAEKKGAKEALEGAIQSLQVASDQLEELKEQTAQLHGACESKAGKVTEIGQQLSQKEEEYTLLSSEFESQKDQTKALEMEIALLSSKLEAQQNQTKELEKEIALKEEVAQEKGCIESMLEEQKSRYSDLSNEMQILKTKLEEKERELEYAKEESSNLSEALKELELLRQKVDALQDKYNELEQENESLRQELQSKEHELEEKQQDIESLRKQTSQHDQLSAEMESVSKVLQKREDQLAALQKEISSKDRAINEFQRTILEKNEDIESLLEEHDQECSELQAKLDALNKASKTQQLVDHELDKDFAEVTKQLQDMRDQLEELGFSTMEELVKGIADKCREHAEMQMQISLLQEEIAGKDGIIQDMTLRLNRDIAGKHLQAFEEKMRQKGEPSTFAAKPKESATIDPSTHTKRASFDEAEAKYGKTASQIEAMAYMLKNREATIEKLQKDLEAKERAISALVRGLEVNVQEKIESDKLVHENKTKCTEFASQVQNLAKELEARDRVLQKMGTSARPMRRNLATLEEIQSLSPEELMDLLTASRVLAEDLEAERERLITNATNMSMALAESRYKVDELTDKLDSVHRAMSASSLKSARKVKTSMTAPSSTTQRPITVPTNPGASSKKSLGSRTASTGTLDCGGSLISNVTGGSSLISQEYQQQRQAPVKTKNNRKVRVSIFKRA